MGSPRHHEAPPATADEPRHAHPAPPLDMAAVRAKLAQANGRQFWRGLDELADTPEFRQFLEAEFPREASVFDAVGRRTFMKLMGASLALAGLNGCTRQPTEMVVPYVKAPEAIVPGLPLYFATAIPLSGYGTGVLVESHMGRPTKVDGNPGHPASLGATDALAQAATLGLCDPDRSQVVRFAGEFSTWSAFIAAAQGAIEKQKDKQGAGLRILSETVTSPTLAAQIGAVLKDLPQARWHVYEPLARDNVRAGAVLAFGEPVEVRYDLSEADVIVALDADLLGTGPGHVRYVREFSRRRRVEGHEGEMNRLYVVEPTPTITGSMADHRLPVRSRDVEEFARRLASVLGVDGAAPEGEGRHGNWIRTLAADLKAHRGKSVVVAGDSQPAIVHALAHAINQALDNVGRTVIYTDPVVANPVDNAESLRELVADMNAGKVEFLVILSANPVYSAPADLRFAAALEKVPLRARLGLYDDETSLLCHWHVPEAHCLESWGDVRAYDGTATIIQPLIAPLYGGRTAHEMIATLTDRPERSAHDLVRDYWKKNAGAADFDVFWRTVLNDGLVRGSALPPKSVTFRAGALAKRGEAPAKAEGLEIVFRPDPSVYDGRFANLGWLQELPRPLTKVTWDNVALLSPTTAERLGVNNEDIVELKAGGRTVTAPAWVLPGQAPDTVTVTVGYGRSRVGRVGNGVGFDAYALRTVAAPWFASGLEVRKTGERTWLACTQSHFSMEGRGLVRAGTLEEFKHDPHFAHEGFHEPGQDLSFYPPWEYDGNAWGMAIDLNACVGCNACVVACQSENNIPVVGKDQVWRGREMHWIRVDRYFAGDLDNPAFHQQPVVCQQCEKAPCEVVCPVGATVHSAEGLNDMVYNRCVGTKYCSNNCPYKVRRFNFYLYSNLTDETLKLTRNPDVTVRTRGVMEKCTYCVQRINHARIQAKKEGRAVRDGEIVTACQQVCPAEAIAFGNINDAASHVAKLKADPRNYLLLGDLNTRPRTSYLAALRNPNPALAEKEGKA